MKTVSFFLRSLCALLIPLITVASHPFLSPSVPLPDSVLLAKGDHTSSPLSPLSPPDFDPAVCPHNHQSTEIVRQLSATQSGLKQRACLDCGNVLEEKTISTLTGQYAYSYDQIKEILLGFHEHFGLSYESIGTTVEGRDIYVYRLGSTDAPHHVLIHAGIHGKEYMNTALLLNLTEYYVLNGNRLFRGKKLSSYLKDVCFHIIPSANPDGAVISRTRTLSADRIQSILLDNGVPRSKVPVYLRYWKSNAAGVDLNRNFDAGWDIIDDNRGHPSYSHYKGPTVASEPETKALIDYTFSYPFNATISYHSFGSEIYWKYGNDRTLQKKCYQLYSAVYSVTGYPEVETDNPAQGGYKDWAILQGIPSLTIETGINPAPLPDYEYKDIFKRNRYVFAAVAAWVKTQ